MHASSRIFAAASLAQLGGCYYCAFKPLRLHKPLTAASLWRSYSLADSNLDVLALAIFNCVAICLLLFVAARLQARQGSAFRDGGALGRSRVSMAIYLQCLTFQLLLLAKAVLVAILGADDLWPTRHRCGLAYLYAGILTALLASFAQSPAARAIVQQWQHAAHRRAAVSLAQNSSGSEAELAAPLLGEDNKGAAAPVSAEARSATIGTLLRLSTPDTPILLLAFSAGAVAALGQALIPYYTGRIIDYASIDPDRAAFVRTTQKLLGVALGCAIFTGIRGGLFTISMTRLNVRLRRSLFESLLRQDASFFDTTRTGEITSRLAADTTTVSDQISLNLNVMLRSTTQAAMVLAFMFSASWRLTVVTFVMVPVVLAICKVYGRYYRKMSKKVQAELAAANSVAEEALGTMPTVKAHAAEGSTKAEYAEKLGRFYALQKREAMAYAAYMMTNTFLSAAVVASVLYYGGSLVLEHTMSAGALVSFMLYQQSLSGAFQSLGDVFSALSAAVGAADKVIELMHRRPAIPPSGALSLPSFEGRIELRDLAFRYPSRPQTTVLSNFNLVINPGEVVALVGPSGGGKSSIVKLVERLYLPTAGAVLVDGRDVGSYDPGWLRRRVALVSQEPVLYARSVRSNITYGLEEADGVPFEERPTQEDVEAAARLANAHDFITALPEGYATECGERGVTLSGGQKQRLAIARALVRRPAVLLLDEATSALDADSEATVQEALDRTMAGRTVLVIAHRLSTVQHASRIVVIQHGQVAEVGTHDDLLAAGGAYASLVRRQLARPASVASLGLVGSASRGALNSAASVENPDF